MLVQLVCLTRVVVVTGRGVLKSLSFGVTDNVMNAVVVTACSYIASLLCLRGASSIIGAGTACQCIAGFEERCEDAFKHVL